LVDWRSAIVASVLQRAPSPIKIGSASTAATAAKAGYNEIVHRRTVPVWRSASTSEYRGERIDTV
jgi:hypothetical protein